MMGFKKNTGTFLFWEKYPVLGEEGGESQAKKSQSFWERKKTGSRPHTLATPGWGQRSLNSGMEHTGGGGKSGQSSIVTQKSREKI